MAIFNFAFDEDKDQPTKYRYDAKLSDIESKRVGYDKQTFIYLEMPKFTKGLEELETGLDKWLYVIRNLHRLDKIPDKLREKFLSSSLQRRRLLDSPRIRCACTRRACITITK